MKLCFLPIYSQLCDAEWVHGDTMWLEELSDNYIPAAFVHYNTGNKEIADVILINPCKMFCRERRQAYLVLNFYRCRYTLRLHGPPIVIFSWHQWRKGQILLIALMCGTRDHLDAFPQLIVNKSSTILHSIVYALYTSCCYISLAIASYALYFSNNNC